jgi:hypothetical protein
MWNFKFILCYLYLATLVGAAEISLSGDNKITGEVVVMDEQGTVTLAVPYANQPLRLNADKITKIDFGKSELQYEIPHQNLTLINGDSFPVEIRGLDDKVLQIRSPVLGDIDVPREIIDTLDIGIFAKKTIYTGPNKIGEWKNGVDEVIDWKLNNGRLTASSNSLIYRDMNLPESYKVRFKLGWDSNPNFTFYFGDPMDYTGKAVNRYYLQFGRAGIEIKRELTTKGSGATIKMIPRPLEGFTDKEVWVEVRVNRKDSRLEVYLNDKLEGRFEDPYPDIPNGKAIAFHSRSMAESQITLSGIEVCEWEDRGERHRSEERGDGKEDAIIGRHGERFGGRIISITDGEEGKVYRFKSDFQEDPIDLPDSEVSSIFFTILPDSKPNKFEGMNLHFQNQGSIQVSKCTINDNNIKITHPLLGDLEMNRQVVSRLEHSSALKSNKTKGK